MNRTCRAALALLLACVLGPACGSGGGGTVAPTVSNDATPQIVAARATADGAVSLPITDAFVTAVKPSVGGDPAGFFIQGSAAGPAIFVAVDPATLAPVPVAGDRVTFTITSLGTTAAQRRVLALSSYSRSSQGNSLAPLVVDVSSATDLVSALDTYESRLVTLTGSLFITFTGSGTGYVGSLQLVTLGYPSPGGAGLEFRIPTTVQDIIDATSGCDISLARAVVWRTNGTCQISIWNAGDVVVTSTPAPLTNGAFALSATSVRITFTRNIAPASVLANGSQFTFDNGLTATAAAPLNARQVVVTTTVQVTAVSYTATVATTVTDTYSTPLAPPGTAAFTGYAIPAMLIINEVSPDTGPLQSLVELLVTSSGSMNGITLRRNPTAASGGTMASLPNVVVTAGDLVVIHLGSPPPIGAATESTGIADRPNSIYSANYDTAWDVVGPTPGINTGDMVLALRAADGVTYIDAVAFTQPAAPNDPNFVASVNFVQGLGLWLPADSGAGVPTTYATTPSVIDISVDWTGVGTTPAGNTVARKLGSNTKTGTDWNPVGTETLGLPNPP